MKTRGDYVAHRKSAEKINKKLNDPVFATQLGQPLVIRCRYLLLLTQVNKHLGILFQLNGEDRRQRFFESEGR
jgi:hypothetical protein